MFEEKKDTRQDVPNCFRTPIPKSHFLKLLFPLAKGLRKFFMYPKLTKNVLNFKVSNFLKRFYCTLANLTSSNLPQCLFFPKSQKVLYHFTLQCYAQERLGEPDLKNCG